MDKFVAMNTFVKIAEKGSLTAAAAALDVSLPSVVRTLAILERDLGVRLLNRTTRRSHLTDDGALYLERCRAILAAMQDAEAALSASRIEPKGKLVVSASVFFGQRYVAPIVSSFIRRYPSVSAELLFLGRTVNLVEEGIDVAVRVGHLQDSSLIAVPVGKLRRVICGSPEYLRRHGTPRTPADVRAHACVRHTALAPRADWQFRAGRRMVRIPIKAAFTCNDIGSCINACLDGCGLGMFLSYQIAPYRHDKKLRYVLEEFETDPIPVHVVYSEVKLVTSKVRAFVDECITKLREVQFN